MTRETGVLRKRALLEGECSRPRLIIPPAPSRAARMNTEMRHHRGGAFACTFAPPTRARLARE